MSPDDPDTKASDTGDNPPKTDSPAVAKEAKIPQTEHKAEHKAEQKTEPKKPPKFIYNCVRCGQYCEKVEGVPVTLEDLRNWQAKEMMTAIMPHLELITDGVGNPRLTLAPKGGFSQPDLMDGMEGLEGLEGLDGKKEGFLNRLRKKKSKKDDDDDDIIDIQAESDTEDNRDESEGEGERESEAGAAKTENAKGENEEEKPSRGCPFHDAVNKLCQIHHAMPTSCSAFPLGYNGSKYFIADKDCQGLGQGQMTIESLKGIRDSARSDFTARTETGQLLTILYGLFMGQMAAQSAKMMGDLDPEKLKQLGELLGQKPPEGLD